MPTRTLGFLILLVLGAAVPARAQSASALSPAPTAVAVDGAREPTIRAGLDLQAALPVGDFGDAANVGLGGLLRYEHTVRPRLAVTGRAGFIYHVPKEVSAFGSTTTVRYWTVPVLAGVKFSALPALYLAGELGVFSQHSSSTLSAFGAETETKDSKTTFGATFGGGLRAGDLDLRLGVHILDLSDAGKSIALVFSLGFNPVVR